ncbi:RHS repeat-associated core domain-containing protein [Streptomyces althioticus]|uniref:RHS repeat-associated core domain-containing protein n=1 Tax=Streptomyces althioticus TaxID=83380 RepID=A0ABZ1Y372_9ACTN
MTSKTTYGYTAYGSNDESEFTGIDKPDATDPTKENYNPYRYNSKRWDAQSGTYDMGFRDYDPGLNRFTTRDMYNGALADMGLGTDPYTGNRYAFTGGNPVSNVELDGHMPAPIDGGSNTTPTGGCGTPGFIGPCPIAAVAPTVQNPDLQKVLTTELYIKAGSVPAVGTGKVSEAVVNELRTGQPTKELWHLADAAGSLRQLQKLREEDRKSKNTLLSAADRKIALAEAKAIWDAFDTPDSTGKIAQLINDNPEIGKAVQSALKRTAESASMASVTGGQFYEDPRGFKAPRLTNKPKMPRILGVAGGVLTIGQAPSYVRTYGWGQGAWEMFKDIVDPFGVADPQYQPSIA